MLLSLRTVCFANFCCKLCEEDIFESDCNMQNLSPLNFYNNGNQIAAVVEGHHDFFLC